MDKTATTEHDVLELIARRWSPRAFAQRPVESEKLLSIFEAARWAASSYNEQPWRFIVTTSDRPEAHGRLLACLSRGNRRWAGAAPVLMLSVAKTAFSNLDWGKDVPNRHAWHDLGVATAQLILQATALGLSVHPMAGFDPEAAREALAVPDGFEPVAALALGYLGDPDTLPEDLRERELRQRSRKPISELVFSDRFGETAEFIERASAGALR